MDQMCKSLGPVCRLLFMIALVIVATLPSVGCVNAQERYDPFLAEVQGALEDVAPKYEAALKASGRDPELIENDVALVNDTIATIKRVREKGPPPPAAAPEGGGP